MALCNLNGDGSAAQSTAQSQSPAVAAAHSHTLQQESTPLLLGHDQSAAAAEVAGRGDAAVTSIEMPTVAGSDSAAVPSLPLPASLPAQPPAQPQPPLLMALPANLNFVTGPTTQQLMIGNGAVGVIPSTNDNNNNNNNVDNTSDESNPVTIYRYKGQRFRGFEVPKS